MRSRTGLDRSRWLALSLGIALILMPLAEMRAQDATRFEADIQAFESVDRVSPPPADPVLFTGSSSVRMWTNVASVFPEYPVLNRGFGGSYMSDLLYYFDRVVAVYRPALVLVYEGDNDLSGGKSVDQVYAEYVEFLARVRQQLPATDVAFIAVKPSPSRVAYVEPMRQLNLRLAALAEQEPDLWFIDVFTPMLDGAGQPRPELFGSDMLHMNTTGYALWQTIVGDMLEEWAGSKGQSFLFDFGGADTPTKKGPAPDDPENSWNNVTEAIGGSATGNLRGVVNTRNKSTAVGLRMIRPFNGSGPNRNGTLESTLFPANATRDSLYGNTELWSGFADVLPSFKLTGLNRERTYTFTFYGSRLGVSDVRETDYTVIGENSASIAYDAGNNVNAAASVYGVVPDASGEITISLAPSARNNNSYHFTYLGVMKVDEVPQQQPIVFVEEPADQTVEEFRAATFRAAVDSTPPYTIQWFQDGLAIPGADEFTYTLEQATLDLDGAVFAVEVSNAMYSAVSAGAVLHVVPDVNAPALLSVQSTNGLSVRLTFDERLDPQTALAKDHYRINDGHNAVVGVELDPDGRTVVLTPELRLTSLFDVTVHGVCDLAGNAIVETTMEGTLRSQALLFDFGSSGTPTTNDAVAWNNVTDGMAGTAGARVNNLVTAWNDPTGISLVILDRFNGANTNGTLASSQFPPDATRDSLFGNTETFNNISNIFPRFKLTGLDPMQTYDFTFYASRMGVSDNRETGYTVEGANSGFAALNASANIETFVTVAGIEPDAAGEITIRLAPTAKNNNGNHFTYLGVMKVEPTLVDSL